MGFVCKVLNYARCSGLADFNSTVTLISWFQFSHCYMCHSPVSCDLINQYVSLQVLQEGRHYCFAAVPDLKAHSALISSWPQYSTSLTVTQLNFLINVLYSDHTAYYKGFCFRCHYTAGHNNF